MGIDANPQWDNVGNLFLKLEIGFYVPKGTIMDRESWAMTKVNIECQTPESWEEKQVNYSIRGHWVVEQNANLSLLIANNPQNEGEIKLSVNATIQGQRPYDFEDNISMSKNIYIKVNVDKSKIEKKCLYQLA